MAHLIFMTGTAPSTAVGSGTWVGISVLRDAVVALGHEVTLLAPQPGRDHNTTWSRVVFNLRARSLLRDRNADVLIGFDLDGVFVAKAGFSHAASIKGVLADEATHESGRRRLGLLVQAGLEAIHVRRADRVITTSDYSCRQISRFYGVARKKILIVPELIDLTAWHRSLSEAPVQEGALRVLCVAHLYPRKGIDTLIQAFAGVRQDSVLRIVGAGPERKRLEHLAHALHLTERIRFLGHLPLHDLMAEYRNACLFALPTSQEGFGIVFLEAMASSLPVIAGRAAAVPEVVVDGVTALLVEPGDEQALTEALEKLLQQSSLRFTMGAAGLAHVQRYDAPLIARKFLEAIGIVSQQIS